MSEELKINNIPLFNIGEKAELENKLLYHLDEFTNEIMKTMTRDKEIIILKKVIEQQQKEIKENQVLIDDIKDHRIVYIDTPEFEEKFISKDKIREKMREIMGYTFTTSEERHCQNYAYDRLKELLEEK